MNLYKNALKLINQVIIGKEKEVKLAFSCLLAGGHLLLEDVPGTGKTTLAIALARVLGCSFARIQFTSDILPADIIGGLVYQPKEGHFIFRPGPIFHQVILADEINRATPKAQSALLEAMEERQVSIEGVVKPLPSPFFVIATQNPYELHGTFPLPESQLDRFFMRLTLGYPSPEKEALILKHGRLQEEARNLPSVFTPETIIKMQKEIQKIHLHEDLLNYVLKIIEKTRKDNTFRYGLSPRGALAWIKAAKAYAFLEGRNYVAPEDIKTVFIPIAFHRLLPKEETNLSAREILLKEILNTSPLPL
ncbi:MAG TPA: MoxR family ATPase [Candidatus Desulfofervidus auxilii]|uniref:MoxR family ATPase n=1 Tax=Desulfofervidus auxilii TaxID=1621989 RepID=A0A7C0U1I0_DESA2|nr:MoxR family ATPase [Candidatus Desulfofervidus auxilii]